MKLANRIPLNESVEVDDGKGGSNIVSKTRSVAEEIARLRYAGMLEAADKLERACEDYELAALEISPVTGKKLTPVKA